MTVELILSTSTTSTKSLFEPSEHNCVLIISASRCCTYCLADFVADGSTLAALVKSCTKETKACGMRVYSKHDLLLDLVALCRRRWLAYKSWSETNASMSTVWHSKSRIFAAVLLLQTVLQLRYVAAESLVVATCLIWHHSLLHTCGIQNTLPVLRTAAWSVCTITTFTGIQKRDNWVNTIQKLCRLTGMMLSSWGFLELGVEHVGSA